MVDAALIPDPAEILAGLEQEIELLGHLGPDGHVRHRHSPRRRPNGTVAPPTVTR